MIPSEASLSDGSTPDQCGFNSLTWSCNTCFYYIIYIINYYYVMITLYYYYYYFQFLLNQAKPEWIYLFPINLKLNRIPFGSNRSEMVNTIWLRVIYQKTGKGLYLCTCIRKQDYSLQSKYITSKINLNGNIRQSFSFQYKNSILVPKMNTL